MSTVTSGLIEVQEITLFVRKYRMAVSSTKQVDSVPHGLGLRPYIDLIGISNDDITYYDPYGSDPALLFNNQINWWMDSTNIYFGYLSLSVPQVIYLEYRAYVTEATK